MDYILALDQGTTSSRAIIFNKSGDIISVAQKEFKQIYPKNGWVEHNPVDILGSIVAVSGEALIRAGIKGRQIKALGITNQRETIIMWDKETGKPVYNAIVWQCRRTAGMCDTLKQQGYKELIYEKTGLIIDAYFSATKVKWILDNIEAAKESLGKGTLLFGTVDTYIMWALSAGRIHATDYTNAARTMLFNIHTLKWDQELLDLFAIPKSILPQVFPSAYYYGDTDENVFGYKIPICGIAGDQQAALFGHLCIETGTAKNTYGTGCFLIVNTGKTAVRSQNGLITSLAASINGRPDYILEGSVFIGGAIIKWLRDGLRIIRNASDSEKYAKIASDNGGVYIVPAFVGLGAPYWDSEARGLITGLTRSTKREHIIRAGLEAIAYQVHDIYRAMEHDLGIKMTYLAVDGGASCNNFLMQYQADILNITIRRPKNTEVTAAGAAYLAGLNSGYWQDINEIKYNSRIEREFKPKMNETDRKDMLCGWKKAINQTINSK